MGIEIVIAIIGAIATLGAPIVATIVSKRAKGRAAAAGSAAAAAAATAIKQVPYTIDCVRSLVKIADATGQGTAQRQILGLRVRNGAKITRFRTRIGTSGKFDPTTVNVSTTDIGKGVTVDTVFPNPQTCDVTIEVIPGLSDSDPALDIIVEASIIGAQLVKAVDIAKAYRRDKFRYEYVSETIETQVKILEIEVTFPSGLVPAAYPMVFYTSSEEMAEEPLKRIPALDTSSGDTAKLKISNPAAAFKYAIYWVGTK